MAAKTTAPVEVLNLSQLDMVLDARQVLAREGATPAEWAANSMLINRYSNGAYTAEGTTPAVRTTAPLPATPTDYQPATRTLPRGDGTTNHSTAPAPRRGDEPVTPNQRALIERLSRKHLTDEAATALIALCDQRTKRTISSVISSLIDMDNRNPRGNTAAAAAQPTDADLPTVPTGRYAVLDSYYKIDNGTGRWAGRVFIRELDADGNELADVRRHAHKLEITTAVAADPHAAVIAYGKATGTCGACERHLEDPQSVDRGIGPYCEANSLGITVSQVYAMRKRATETLTPLTPTPALPALSAETPAEPAEITAPAPTPAPLVAGKALTEMTFAQVMELAKQLKVPGRGTARLPELRAGVAAALSHHTLAA